MLYEDNASHRSTACIQVERIHTHLFPEQMSKNLQLPFKPTTVAQSFFLFHAGLWTLFFLLPGPLFTWLLSYHLSLSSVFVEAKAEDRVRLAQTKAKTRLSGTLQGQEFGASSYGENPDSYQNGILAAK